MAAEDFRRNFQAGDIDAMIAGFAPGFRVFHAGQEESTSDPDFIRIMFRTIRAVFGDQFRFSDCVPVQAHGEPYKVLPWTTVIDGIKTEGFDLVKEDGQGRLLELRVAIRPASALQAISLGMKARLGDFLATHGPDASSEG